MEEAPKNMPVMATCWGYEFLNIYFGGSLLQHVEDPEKQHLKNSVNKIIIDENSWLYKQHLGESLEGTCSHHQNLDKIPDQFKVTARD